MKSRKTIVLSLLIATVLILVMWGIARDVSSKKARNRAYTTFCNTIAEVSKNNPDWHLAIYLDVRACLSCCEDMKAWQELEERLPQCGGALSLWAPREDSVDVAVAMKLEGLKTPVRVLSAEMIEALGWKDSSTPVKVLFDNQCEPEKVIGTPSGGTDSRRIIGELLAKVCSEG